MKTTIYKLKSLPTFFVFFVFFSGFLNCYAEDYYFSDYLDRINTIIATRSQVPKSIYKNQRNILINHESDIRELNFNVKNSRATYDERRKNFDTGGKRRELIEEWERQVGISWPKYTCKNCCRKNSNCNHHFLEAHHIVPLGYNGKNKWWNIFPLTKEEHTGRAGIHSSEEGQAWFPKVKKKK